MSPLNDALKKELTSILVFLGIIWGVFLLSFVVPLNSYGLQPRSVSGLLGIISMPFLHANIGHIVANTLPLIVLLVLLAGSRAKSWGIVAEIVVLGGVLLWVFGRSGDPPRVHIGASGLVFGLVAFLVLSGIFERRPIPILVAVITFVLYGGSLLWGLIPSDSAVSWDGHLCGAVAGGLLAFQLAKQTKKAPA